MPLNPIYYAGMFAIHLGLFGALFGVISGIRHRRWVVASYQAVCTAAILSGLVAVYSVIPALWWPDGLLHFVEHVLDCLWAAGLSLLGHLALVLQRLKKRSPATA